MKNRVEERIECSLKRKTNDCIDKLIKKQKDNTEMGSDAVSKKEENEKNQKSVLKCKVCNKRLIRWGGEYECKCGGLFCLSHKVGDRHACTFDYRKEAREKLQKNNPKVVKDKIRKLN